MKYYYVYKQLPKGDLVLENNIAITQFIVNHDTDFEKYKRPGTIIVNDINGLIDSNATEAINNELYTIYKQNYVNVNPICNCGYFNSKYRENRVCPKCNTVCKNDDGSKPVLWIRALKDRPFINTVYWQMIRYAIDGKIDVLRWLSDSAYNPPKRPEFLPGLLSVIGGKRGYIHLLNNFEKVLIYLKNISKFKKKPKSLSDFDDYLWMWRNKKEDILSNYLPITSKKLFVMENTNKGKFINLLVSATIEVVNGWLLFEEDRCTENKMNNLIGKTLSTLTESNGKVIKDYIAGKKRMMRKQVYGYRVPNSSRVTVVARCGPHRYDMVEIPYSAAVSAYTPQILNFLMNRYNFKYREASRYVYKHTNLYSPIIGEIFDTMCKESKYGCLMIETHRNPTLLPGSKMRVGGTVKKDANDKTLGISPLIVSIPNGDFDGRRFKCK